MLKPQIRTTMKDSLTAMTSQDRHRRSMAACDLVAGTREFRHGQLIMLYLSLPSEVETATLAVRAWAEGKQIAVPRVDWGTQKMDPVEINSLDVGMETSKGVREPVEGRVVPLDLIDMVIIPGMAFDRRGYRVGRGRGFYDRFLAQQGFRGIRCALCFHEQLIDEVPAETHDIPMDLVVTDREVIHCARAGKGR